MIRVTGATLRKGGVCLNGARRMCPSLGLDFRRLIRHGYSVDELRHIDDATVRRLIEIAERGAGDGQQQGKT